MEGLIPAAVLTMVDAGIGLLCESHSDMPAMRQSSEIWDEIVAISLAALIAAWMIAFAAIWISAAFSSEEDSPSVSASSSEMNLSTTY
jgi:phosphatidylglycerophosphatase A